MIIRLENSKQIRGDLIKSAVVRSDLTPIPMTFEADIRTDSDMASFLAEGKLLTVNGDFFRIIALPADGKPPMAQGDNGMESTKIIALLDSCCNAAFIRSKALTVEKTTLAAIYKASGASLKAVDADISVPYFCCLSGGCPTMPIAQVLQEQGGVVRWKNGKLTFFRLPDLFNQKIALSLKDGDTENVNSGFLERHEVPSFYSIADDGGFIYGNRTKPRTATYVPNKNEQQLQNMSRCLIHRKQVPRMSMSPDIAAGDLIGIDNGKTLVVITAAHAFMGGGDGSGSDAYTRLWLGDLMA